MRDGRNKPLFSQRCLQNEMFFIFFFSLSALEKNVKKHKTTSVCRLEFRSNFAKRNRRLLAVYFSPGLSLAPQRSGVETADISDRD